MKIFCENWINDFYSSYDEFSVSEKQEKKYEKFKEKLNDDEKKIMDENKHYYEIKFTNKGGLVMPVILDFTLENKEHEVIKIPAEIWVKNNYNLTKVFAFNEKVIQIELDPFLETADTDRSNNFWPEKTEPSKFELYKYKDRHDKPASNPMKKKK